MGALDLIILPDEDDDEAAEVLLDGEIAGRPYRFLLDTGAARSSVRSDEYTATLARLSTHTASGVFGASSYDLITVPQIAVGPILRRDFTIVRVPEGGADRRNLIGMDLLSDHRCHFLFDERRVLIDPADADRAYPSQTLVLDGKAHPYIEVAIGEHTAKTVWDTGAGITVADANYIERHPAAFQMVGYSTGTDSTGAEQQTPMYTMAATTIGGFAFPPIRVASVDLAAVNATIDLPMDLILGYNAHQKAHWIFDFPRRIWGITQMLN